jgi:RHS repeat-associated protein
VAAVTSAAGGPLSEQRYLPFGAERLTPDIGETDFGFTGQRDLAAVGLMDYNARFYDAGIGRFASADSIVPSLGNPQALNRFSYVENRPVNSIDPSGHIPCYDPALSCGFPTGKTPPQTQNPTCSSLYCSPIYTANPSPSRGDPIEQNLNTTTVVIKPISIANASDPMEEAGEFIVYFAGTGPAGALVYSAEVIALAVDQAEPYLMEREENGLLILDYTYRTSTQTYDIGTLFVRNLSNHPVAVHVGGETFRPSDGGAVPLGSERLRIGRLGVVGSGRQEFFPLNLSVEGTTVLTISLFNLTFDSYDIIVPQITLP